MTARLFGGLILGCLLSLAGIGCSKAPPVWGDVKPGQKRVLASFPPLYCMVANVAGDQAKTLCLLSGQGPHGYQGTQTDALKVVQADLFFINGLELDDQLAKKLVSLARNKQDRVIKVGDRLDDGLLEHFHHEEEMAKDGKMGHKHDDHHHHHGEHDPHIWLGLIQAREMVTIIAQELGKADPANQKAYQDRAEAYSKQLRELEEYGRKMLGEKKNRQIVTMHEALLYFARNFDIEIVDHIQFKPGEDADPNRLAQLVQKCKKNNVRVITIEPQYPAGQAETLVNLLKKHGVEVQLAVFDTLETAEVGPDGNPSLTWYIERMKQNIDNLARALP